MVTTVPSRFAVLSIEDDDFKPRKPQKPATKTSTKAKDDKRKPQQPQGQKKDDKKKQNNKGKKKKPNSGGQQWEQWKEKDSMAVEETYEQELHEAIMLSKLSYQEAQVEVKSNKPEINQDNVKKNNAKKSKKSTMSLEEFNNLDSTLIQNPLPVVERKYSTKDVDAGFFEKLDKEANKELVKEKVKAALEVRLNQLDDNILSAQLRVEVEKRDDTIKELKVENERLKEELSNVRNRNTKLYQILQQGEMKDKAAVLAEVTKLQEIRDELTLEVTSLHAQLEQERSKTRASSTDTKTSKQNNKKRLASDNA